MDEGDVQPMKIMVISGPNLNKLGQRDPGHYGKATYRELMDMVRERAKTLGMGIEDKQSNCEGRIIDFIQEADAHYDGIIINPGAYSHYSYAIMDALLDISIPAVEVHLSDVENREDFRRILVTAKACGKMISGKGAAGYLEALDHLYEGGRKP
ncbi:MAG: type II 3-dehydroquinate dehydratase [Clostridia bacterium]